MVLTFKSSIPEQRVIIERNGRGDQRVARAVQADNPKTWNLSLEHPSGSIRRGTYHGDGNSVNVALTQMLMESENDYKAETARGHRPAPTLRDPNVRVNDVGNDIGAPVKAYAWRTR